MKLILQFPATSKGFTLIEILIVVSISGVMLVLLYSSLFQVINAKDRVEERNVINHEVRAIFSSLGKDLANLYPKGKTLKSTEPKVPYFLGTLENDNSKLVFTSRSRDTLYNKNQSDQTVISYYLLPLEGEDYYEEDKELFALVRRDNPYFEKDRGIVFPISERIALFNVNYLDEKSFNKIDKEKNNREWDSSVVNSLPKAIEVNIAIRNKKGEDEHFSKIITIPIAK